MFVTAMMVVMVVLASVRDGNYGRCGGAAECT